MIISCVHRCPAFYSTRDVISWVVRGAYVYSYDRVLFAPFLLLILRLSCYNFLCRCRPLQGFPTPKSTDIEYMIRRPHTHAWLPTGALPDQSNRHPGYVEQAPLLYGCGKVHDASAAERRAEGAHPSPQGRAQELAAHVPVSKRSAVGLRQSNLYSSTGLVSNTGNVDSRLKL